MKLVTAIFMLILMLAPAYASPPVPPQKTQSLEILKDKIAAEEARKADLAKQAKAAEKDITKTKSNMVELSAKIRKNEDSMQQLQRRVDELTLQEKELKIKLENDHGSMATTILALERMRRVPPELLIVRPGAPLETAQTALLLQNLLPALNHRAESLSKDIQSLHDVQEKLTQEQKFLQDAQEALDKQTTELNTLVATREKEFKSANAAYKSSAARAERYATEAQSLSELVSRIEQENRAAATAPDAPPKFRPSKAFKGRGKGIWPVSGGTIATFGDFDDLGAEVKGMKISAAPKSIVVTPVEGVVKYAGPFRNYGQLVIVEHGGGYHSLIAGMTRANVSIGQSLKAGEPLGYMPSSSSQDGPLTLYYELRRDGEAVDPSNLLADLKS